MDDEPAAWTSSTGLGRLLASTGVSVAGQGTVIAAVPLLAASLTKDPFAVSLTVGATYAAWLIVGLPAGAFVDRWPRRRTMIVADLARCLLLAILAFSVATNRASIPLLVAVVFLVGTAACFFDPAAQAAIPMLVGRDQDGLVRANSWMWSLDLIGRALVGPPLGAALFAFAAVLPFGINSVTFLVSAVLLIGLPRLNQPSSDSPRTPVISSIREGVRFLWSSADLRVLTLGMGAFNLIYNIAYATLVLFSTQTLGLHDWAYGVLLAMLAVGGLIGAWITRGLGTKLRPRQIYALGLFSQAIAWALIALWASPIGAGIALVVVGAGSMLVTVAGGAARQALSPDALLGRVGSGTRVIGIGSAAIGALLGGALAGAGSLVTPYVVAGVMAALTAVAFAGSRFLWRSADAR